MAKKRPPEELLLDAWNSPSTTEFIRQGGNVFNSIAQSMAANPLAAFIGGMILSDIAVRTRLIGQPANVAIKVGLGAYIGVDIVDTYIDAIPVLSLLTQSEDGRYNAYPETIIFNNNNTPQTLTLPPAVPE